MKFSNSPVLSQVLPIWRSRLLQLALLENLRRIAQRIAIVLDKP